MGYVHGVNLADELDEVEGFAGCGELSLMQHEQIAQNEPALQTEQAAMPAWTQRVVAAGEDGDAVADARPAALRCRRQTLPLRSIELRSSAPFRVRAVAASRRSLPPWHTHRRCWACRAGRARPGPDVWKPLRLVRRRCSARYGGTYRAGGGGALTEPDIVATSMRVAPGVTLWGPVAAPEQAELMARPVELLLDVLRRESDVVFIDTSVFWGDAVAAAVAASDRCLIVGDAAVSSATSASRVIELASRVGVPRTRMSAVFNRFGARGADEDVAMRFEIACALSSKIRIADGGQDLAALMAFGRADEAVGQTSAFGDQRARGHARDARGTGVRRRPLERYSRRPCNAYRTPAYPPSLVARG